MFTAVMSLALLGLVVVSGLVYTKAMDELLARPAEAAAETPRR